ncbi:MAG: tRNA (adenosine(37)-N6)-threonylcarbamoyltransferase complex dimerization subunit type 1 TsaB [Christensenellales bacterium]
MKILVIDSVADRLVIAACNGDRVASRISDGNKRHNGAILPLIDEVLDELSMTVKDLDGVACVVGAGSFTGIRIGISTAEALATACNLKTIPITAFEEIAYDCNSNCKVVAIDCGHGEYYAAKFDGNWQNINEFCIYNDEQLKSMGQSVLYKTTNSNPLTLLEIAKWKMQKGKYGKLAPLYMKKSQAEREKDGN